MKSRNEKLTNYGWGLLMNDMIKSDLYRLNVTIKLLLSLFYEVRVHSVDDFFWRKKCSGLRINEVLDLLEPIGEIRIPFPYLI